MTTTSSTQTESPVKLINARPVPHPGRWVGAAILLVFVAMIVNGLVKNPVFQWDMVLSWLFSKTIMQAIIHTLILTAGAMILGTIIAIAMAVMRQSPNPIMRGVATFYIWFFRGTPVYTQLIFWSLLPVILPTLSIGIPFGPEFVTFETTKVITIFWMALLGLGFNEGAYLAEIIRAGLNSVDKGQWEAATALGMSRTQIMARIVMPQAMRVIVPPLGNETISMLKTTSLVSAIPYIYELTFVARDLGQRMFAPVPMLLTAAIWYLVITSVLMVIQHYIERHFGKGYAENASATKGKEVPGEQEDIDGQMHNEMLFLDVTP
ncbi:amino acid ABC transporter permease [Actinomycetaceae bacterium MB13-C1-2]|nr:amino acid ABC transporter permease [Actinomycetaceae bacterium MB13-C1-2]